MYNLESFMVIPWRDYINRIANSANELTPSATGTDVKLIIEAAFESRLG